MMFESGSFTIHRDTVHPVEFLSCHLLWLQSALCALLNVCLKFHEAGTLR